MTGGRTKTLRDLMRDYERNIVAQTILRNNGNRDVSAKALGITRRALDKILERHHMLIRRRWTKVLPILKQQPPKPIKPEEP